MNAKKPRNKRIHFISTNPSFWGGSEDLWHGLAMKALEEGHEVLVSVFRHPQVPDPIRKLESKGARMDYRRLPCYHPGQSFPSLVWAHFLNRLNWNRFDIAWWWASRFKADAILVSAGEALDGYLFDDSFPIRDAIRRGIPYLFIGHFHHEHSKILSKSDRERKARFLGQAAAQLFVSIRNLQMTRSELQQDLPNARIIHNPLHVKESPSRRTKPGPTIRMAFVARLECEVKCQDLVVQALADASFEGMDLIFYLYGEGDDREYLESLISYHGLEGKVRLMGRHPNPGEIWDDHEILVLTSRGEGTPLTLFEAMRAGRTAIVTNAGDSALWMADGRGYICPAPTVEAIRETLLRAFSERATWEEKGERCRLYLRSKWMPNHADDVYSALLGEGPAGEIGFEGEAYLKHLDSDMAT